MTNAIQTITGDIYAIKERFTSVSTGTGINFEREAEFAIQVIGANDYMQKIAMGNRQSVVNAVQNVAAIGISLNPAKKQAYLVPRDGKICLDISYMGLIDLAVQDGAVRWAKAELVYANDQFSMNGAGQAPTHGHNPFSKERGELVGAYCVAKLPDGDYLTETMSIEEINAIRDRSSAWKAWLNNQKKCPWVTDNGEMCRKTVVKRASKYWASSGSDRLQQAIHHLNTDGDEGLADLAPKEESAFDIIAALDAVQFAPTLAALDAIWESEAKKATAAKDKGGYAALRNACKERKAQLNNVTDVETT